MLDPRLLYTLNPALMESVRGTRPALLHLLDGYIDAGSVTHAAGRYLLEACEHEVLVEFDHDQLHDYRSRRPQMVFDTNQWVSMTDFSLVIHRLLDTEGTPFLMLT
ncbi:MAG: PAC2 family protein, partial [Actinobacteria bacterium]|nr:PAC2 family protein [Actinomycetota bacterium]